MHNYNAVKGIYLQQYLSWTVISFSSCRWWYYEERNQEKGLFLPNCFCTLSGRCVLWPSMGQLQNAEKAVLSDLPALVHHSQFLCCYMILWKVSFGIW